MSEIKYYFEDALQIYHAKAQGIEVFEMLIPEYEWQGITRDAINPTDDYYSDDEIIAFDLMEKDEYISKVCGGMPCIDEDKPFPVLVIVRKPRAKLG